MNNLCSIDHELFMYFSWISTAHAGFLEPRLEGSGLSGVWLRAERPLAPGWAVSSSGLGVFEPECRKKLGLISYLWNKKTTHTSYTSHTDGQCKKCGKCGIKKRLAIHTFFYARNDIPTVPSKMMLITKILMLISGILTIRIFLMSIRILLANISTINGTINGR